MQFLGLQAQVDAFRGVMCSIGFLPVLISYRWKTPSDGDYLHPYQERVFFKTIFINGFLVINIC